jgi:hypothetical protein
MTIYIYNHNINMYVCTSGEWFSNGALVCCNENQLTSHLVIILLRIELTILTKMRTKSLKTNYFIFIKKFSVWSQFLG